MKTKIAAILLAGATTLMFVMNARSDVIFQDNFDGALSSTWQVHHQDISYYAISTNGLLLRCNAGDNYESATNYKNLFLITNPAPQEFTFTAKLRWVTLPTVNWGQIALVAYDDDDNYVRVDSQFGNGNKHIESFTEVSGSLSSPVGWGVKDFGTNQFWLQMRQKGTNYSAWYSTDGISFTQINASLNYPKKHPAKLGFVAMVDPTETARLLVSSVTVEAPLAGSLHIDTYAGQVRLQLTGTVGANYQIEFTPELPTTNWSVLTNVLLPSSPYQLFDSSSATNYGQRFYRAPLVQ
jgi:hypothetical protein